MMNKCIDITLTKKKEQLLKKIYSQSQLKKKNFGRQQAPWKIEGALIRGKTYKIEVCELCKLNIIIASLGRKIDASFID